MENSPPRCQSQHSQTPKHRYQNTNHCDEIFRFSPKAGRQNFCENSGSLGVCWGWFWGAGSLNTSQNATRSLENKTAPVVASSWNIEFPWVNGIKQNSQAKSYLEPQTTIYKWLFQVDDCKSVCYRKNACFTFHQTSIWNWLFWVPGIYWNVRSFLEPRLFEHLLTITSTTAEFPDTLPETT